MDQLALPYRIGLGALLVVAALWFTILKPGPVEAPEPAPAAPGVTGLGNAVDGAKGAVATANAAGEAAAADPTAEAAPAAGGAIAAPRSTKEQAAAKAKSAQPADAAAPLLRDLEAGKVVVLAFLGKGSDEDAVRAGLRGVSRRDGRVVVRTDSVRRVGGYAAITAGVKVVGTPTVLVLGKGPKARAVKGLTTTAELDQAVVDMLERTRR